MTKGGAGRGAQHRRGAEPRSRRAPSTWADAAEHSQGAAASARQAHSGGRWPPSSQAQQSGGRWPPSRSGRGVGRRGAKTEVAPAAILRAVESLYEDRVKPLGRIIRKRISEQAALGPETAELDEKDLRAACEASPWLVIEDAASSEWAALLVGRPECFVDVHSPEDLYTPELWAEAAVYFDGLRGEEMVLPGGRYMCARVLQDRQLPFLTGYTLGHIAHIVQLAISHKKLLGYSEGSLVPYAHSQSMLKERHAQCQRPCPGNQDVAVATWDTLREHLHQVLAETCAQRTMPLSNLKRIFRTRFSLELSETALGHSKLSELLQDPRLQDICQLKMSHAGLVLLPVKRSPISLVEGLGLDATDGAPPEPRGRPMPLSLEEIASAPSPTGEARDWLTPLRTPFPPTPSPSAAAYGLMLPRLLGSVRAMPPGLEDPHQKDSKEGGSSEALLAPLDESRPAGPERGAGRAPADFRWAPLTPSTLDGLGFSVSNTFIDAALPPLTPMKAGSRLRASSLPRTAG